MLAAGSVLDGVVADGVVLEVEVAPEDESVVGIVVVVEDRSPC